MHERLENPILRKGGEGPHRLGAERRQVACRGKAKLKRARLGRTRASCENGEQEQATQGRANFTGAALVVKSEGCQEIMLGQGTALRELFRLLRRIFICFSSAMRR
jgi:hypothetical protein